MEENSGNGPKYISLQPFIHQVGGHSSLLCLDEATICKPCNDREQLFYESIPEPLKSFVPSYYGIIKVHLIQDGDYITLSATSPLNYKPKPPTNSKQLRVRSNGSIESDEVSGGLVFDESDVSASLNPWVLKCHKEYISSLATRMSDRGPLKFIVLENLTWRFNLPCILDLKMGTRQYSDNDSLDKKQRKMVKTITTTSAKLGVRITGMQVYQASSGRFLCRNKLYGRSLTTAGFKNAVRNFLHDGTQLRTDTLPPLIRRLEELRSVLTQLDTLRLYTTSLLLLYEGRCAINNDPASVNHQFEMRRDTDSAPRAARASSEDRLQTPPPPTLPCDLRKCRSVSCSSHERKSLRPVGVLGEEPLTDVRIIDFAHSTHVTMDDQVLYSGPDNGFLLGLNNMIQLLKSMLADPPEEHR